jgi:hypothetical protein
MEAPANTDLSARAEQLASTLDAPEATTWRPDRPEEEHPQLLIGELVSVTSGHTVWGEKQIAILKDTEGQLWNVWLLKQVLIDEFVRQQPKIGELLAIRYEGVVHREPPQKPYEKYKLRIDRKGAAVAWNPLAGTDTPPAPPVAAPAPVQQTFEPAPPAAETDVACEACGFLRGFHKDGCPLAAPKDDDIPF